MADPKKNTFGPGIISTDLGDGDAPCHDHTVVIDEDGNGETSYDVDHKHSISGWVVGSAMGHDHRILGLPSSVFRPDAIVKFPYPAVPVRPFNPM